MLSLKINENQNSEKFCVTREDQYYNIKVDYPYGLPFNLTELERIRLANPVRVKQVWIASDSKNVCIYCSVHIGSGVDWTIDSKILVIETKIRHESGNSDKKRQRFI